MKITNPSLTPAGLLILSLGFSGHAQTTPSASQCGAHGSSRPGEFDSLLEDIKHPADWLAWGGDFRYRNEFFNNAASITPSDKLHEQDVQRFRARVWSSATDRAGISPLCPCRILESEWR